MEYFDIPVSPIAGSITRDQQSPVQNDATKQISSLFLKNMLKEVYKNETENSMIFSDMIFDKMIEQLSESDAFGINALIKNQMDDNKKEKNVDETKG